ncbi:MAG: ABC transporter permease [Bacteroidales bacterium]|nr:ABC transporter permease [Bacteroidales bacterium]
MLFRKKKYISSASLSRLAWKRFKKNTLSFISLFFIFIAILISLLGYLITPDPTPFANEQFLELTIRKPGFSVEMLLVRKNEKIIKPNFFKKMIWGEKSIYTSFPFLKYKFIEDNILIEEYSDPTINDGLEKLFNLADIVYPLSPDNSNIKQKGKYLFFNDIYGIAHKKSIEELKNIVKSKHIIKRTFLLGTDRFGRDLLSQLLIGTRVSLSVGFISVFISLIIGIFLGSLAGFFRGWIDNLIVWFINVIWSIPTLLLVIAITFALGKGFWQVFIAVGLTMWVEVARVVRGQILSIREKEFVEAAKSLGFGNFRIIFRHILPNIMGVVIVISAANFAAAILIEAGLSFLGIGVQPPMPSWGTMIKENYGYIILDSAYLAILPGIAIMLMVLAFMLIGNGLRDALDVRTVDK